MPVSSEIQEMFKQRDKLVLRGIELRNFYPLVSFKIPAIGLSRRGYRKFMTDLLSNFARFCDPRNKGEAQIMKSRCFDRPNEENGIGCIYIDDNFITHCKMYVCDGTRESRWHDPDNKQKTWRGVMFRDHAEPNSEYTTAKVFLIADALEKFLISKAIKFTRVNRKK